ncbi:MAG: DUF1573 domain-containing protein [Cyclobacteriaceae bacterium]
MKKSSLLFFGVLVVAFAYAQVPTGTAPKGDVAAFAWTTQVHDFGKIKQGVPVTHEFTFTNSGSVPLVITNVQASCGCTTPDWSKAPVMPGGKGFIKATYSAASSGAFDKSVTVTANVEEGFVSLRIKGEVEMPSVPNN